MERSIERAARLLAAQHGVAHAAQLRRCGMTHAAIAARVRSGSWLLAGEVVVVAGAAETPLRAVWQALVTVGTREDGRLRTVAVGGRSAALVLGLPAEAVGARRLAAVPAARPEVVVGRGVWCPRDPAVRVREVRDWADRAFVRVGGLLVTALPDTLVDLAAHLSDAEHLALLQAECYGRPGLLARVLARCHQGSVGSARARRVAAVLAAGLDSPLHARAVAALRAAGLGPDRCDAEVVAGAGPSDCVYERAGRPVLALEFDGDVHRASRRAFLHDRAKDLRLREAGCPTLRFSVEQVTHPARLVADVRRALAAVAPAAPAPAPAAAAGAAAAVELTVPSRASGVA